jgi:hypothetical protein
LFAELAASYFSNSAPDIPEPERMIREHNQEAIMSGLSKVSLEKVLQDRFPMFYASCDKSDEIVDSLIATPEGLRCAAFEQYCKSTDDTAARSSVAQSYLIKLYLDEHGVLRPQFHKNLADFNAARSITPGAVHHRARNLSVARLAEALSLQVINDQVQLSDMRGGTDPILHEVVSACVAKPDEVFSSISATLKCMGLPQNPRYRDRALLVLMSGLFKLHEPT